MPQSRPHVSCLHQRQLLCELFQARLQGTHLSLYDFELGLLFGCWGVQGSFDPKIDLQNGVLLVGE